MLPVPVPVPVPGATLPLDGVPVLEAVALEVALSCFVGDFVGDFFSRGQPILLGMTDREREGNGRARKHLRIVITYSDETCRASPRDGTWTGSVEAPSFCRCGIAVGSSCLGRCGSEAARAARLSHRLGARSLSNDGRHHGFDKHAVPRRTVKVPHSLDAAIILARLLLKLNANPLAHLKVGLPGKSNGGLAAIAELDRLARPEVGHYEVTRGRESSIVVP